MPRYKNTRLTKPLVPAGGGIKVTVSDPEHPHYGEHGTMTGDLIQLRFSGETMALVKLENCQHGTDACYVAKGQVKER